MIPKGYKANLDTIIRAAENSDLALIECQEKATGKTVIVLAAVGFDEGNYVFSPLAQMFDGNPYELLNPPAPEGGFEGGAK